MPLNLAPFLSKGWYFNPQMGAGALPSTRKKSESHPLKPGDKRFPHQR